MEAKLINTVLIDGTRSSCGKLKQVYCSNCNNCNFYKLGTCLKVNIAVGEDYCPYGKLVKTTGLSTRARGYADWENKVNAKFSESLSKLKGTSRKLCVIGDYVYLPYAFLNNLVNPLGFVTYEHFCKVEDFTVENIVKLIDYRPRAFFGGEIRKYQEHYMPLFVSHLRECFPSLYDEVVKIYPTLVKISIDTSYIGRKAFLKTVVPNSVFIKADGVNAGTFIWTGEELVCNNCDVSFAIVNDAVASVSFKPSDSTVIVITDNSQVDSNTKFAN